MSYPDDSIVDEGMVGTWKMTPPDGDTASYLNILPFNEHEYFAETWEAGSEDDLVAVGIFTTVLNGVQLANVRCLLCDKEDGAYFFFKYDVVNELELIAVSVNDDLYDELAELESVDAVRSFILERMKDDDFFDDEEGRYKKLDEWVMPWQTAELDR